MIMGVEDGLLEDGALVSLASLSHTEPGDQISLFLLMLDETSLGFVLRFNGTSSSETRRRPIRHLSALSNHRSLLIFSPTIHSNRILNVISAMAVREYHLNATRRKDEIFTLMGNEGELLKLSDYLYSIPSLHRKNKARTTYRHIKFSTLTFLRKFS